MLPSRTAARPLAIIAALSAEIDGLLDDLRRDPQSRTEHLAGRDFHVGALYDVPCVVTLSRIGKVAAAITATALIQRFDVGGVLFVGLAGGIAPQVKVGDVVLADALLQHDLDASPLFPRHEIPQLGVSRLPTHAPFNDALAAAAAAFLADRDAPRTGAAQPALHRGLIVSGDRFVSTAAEVDALRARCPDALAVEMEGAAVAQVCHEFGVPCAVLRTVSDRADDHAIHDFGAFLANVASVYSQRIVRTFLAALAVA